jgi:hypothetical protein
MPPKQGDRILLAGQKEESMKLLVAQNEPSLPSASLASSTETKPPGLSWWCTFPPAAWCPAGNI